MNLKKEPSHNIHTMNVDEMRCKKVSRVRNIQIRSNLQESKGHRRKQQWTACMANFLNSSHRFFIGGYPLPVSPTAGPATGLREWLIQVGGTGHRQSYCRRVQGTGGNGPPSVVECTVLAAVSHCKILAATVLGPQAGHWTLSGKSWDICIETSI